MVEQHARKHRIGLAVMLSFLVAACSGTATPSGQTPGSGTPPVREASPNAKAGTAVDDAPLWGDAPGIRQEYKRCMSHQPDDASTAGHREGCASAEWEYQDQRLDQVLAKVRAAHGRTSGRSTADASDLDTAQVEWESRSGKTCEAASSNAAFGMGPAIYSTCLMQLTAERANELEHQYANWLE